MGSSAGGSSKVVIKRDAHLCLVQERGEGHDLEPKHLSDGKVGISVKKRLNWDAEPLTKPRG